MILKKYYINNNEYLAATYSFSEKLWNLALILIWIYFLFCVILIDLNILNLYWLQWLFGQNNNLFKGRDSSHCFNSQHWLVCWTEHPIRALKLSQTAPTSPTPIRKLLATSAWCVPGLNGPIYSFKPFQSKFIIYSSKVWGW